ncbi:MAG: hypothetical protein QNJ60_01790 [Xenococcaceae cyanobacterium MO_188.B19]|nr:hypothetical protein [Xenococcaceae cyanobacterium MO_188.B19]
MQGKDKKGRFISKSKSDRQVKSIRATDETWNKFGEEAEKLSITRADLLETMFGSSRVIHDKQQADSNSVIHGQIQEILVILNQGITPKNQGGFYIGNNAKSLKEQVQIAIALLEQIAE